MALESWASEEVIAAREELSQLRGLLSSAVTGLLGEFEKAVQRARDLDGVVGSLALGRRDPDLETLEFGTAGGGCGLLHRAAELSRYTSGHLGSAITYLQFQDMASQLIDHVDRRLLRTIDCAAGGIADPDSDIRNPVGHTEMTIGSIDLF